MADFEAIYREYFPQVYKYVFTLCRDEALAEEITQQTFYKALESMDKFDGRARLYVWLCQIAKNTYFTHVRKQKRETSDEEVLLHEEAGRFEEAVLDRDDVAQIHRMLHQMKEPYKEVFFLRVFGELPFSEIGALFGKTDSWARLVFYRAKSELRRGLDEGKL